MAWLRTGRGVELRAGAEARGCPYRVPVASRSTCKGMWTLPAASGPLRLSLLQGVGRRASLASCRRASLVDGLQVAGPVTHACVV